MSGGERPLVAIIANVLTPYRLHLHRRIARELSGEIRLATLFTHDAPDQPWTLEDNPEIGPVRFGNGHPVMEQGRPRWAMKDWAKGGAIIEWLKEHKAAAVVVGGYNDLTRLRVIRWCDAQGVPVFMASDSNVHGDLATRLKRRVKDVYVRAVLRMLTGLLPCGTNGAKYFERYGARAEEMFWFPYEPDYAMIEGIGRGRIEEAAAKHGLAKGRRRIVTCARLVGRKRVDLVIDAFIAVADDAPDLDLVIIGDGPEREALRARVPERLRGRVAWTGFIGDQDEVTAIYKLCDLMILASDDEPWAVVVNEAAAAGLAIITSDVVGAAPELVRPGVNGATFGKGRLPELIGALRGAIEPATLARLRKGSARVLAEWRREGDPVLGLARALAYAGVLRRRDGAKGAAGGAPRRLQGSVSS